MENKELKKPIPVELDDDALGNVSGGTDSKTIINVVISNTVPKRETEEDTTKSDLAASGFLGVDV